MKRYLSILLESYCNFWRIRHSPNENQLSILLESYCNGIGVVLTGLSPATFNSPRVLLQPSRWRASWRARRTFNSPRVLLQHLPMSRDAREVDAFNSPRVLLQPFYPIYVVSDLELAFNSPRVLLQQGGKSARFLNEGLYAFRYLSFSGNRR